jgi:c-di-GMP phosphodiesterase
MHSAFIARQPIFNAKLDVVGYELLFRGRGWADDALADSPEHASATVVLNSLTELELTRIVGRKRAWVNVPREFVLDGLARAMPADLGGLEISESEVFDEEMVTALRELKAQGYQLSLDGFGPGSGAEPVLDLFDVVKVNVQDLGQDGLSEQVQRLRKSPCMILADGVATHPDHEFCVRAGCDLFQGYFFCQPAVVGSRSISANRLALLQVVAALQRPDAELADVDKLIARDVALSYRMLRYVNSAFFGVRSEVRSIGQAMALLGLENARRWATLSVMASVDDKPVELTLTALTRARFCELAGEEGQIAGASELFTLGLFSVLDALMDTPMREAVQSLPLADDIRDALVYRRGPMGELLAAVAAREQGQGGPTASLPHGDEIYLRSVIWANNAAESLFGQVPSAAPAAHAPSTEPATAASPPVPSRPGGGVLRRLFAAVGRRFGRGVV